MRPSRDDVLMDHARLVARRSTCSRLHVGSVASREGRLLVSGYNGAPSGIAHCDHEGSFDPCQRSVHAEANVIAYAARWGIRLMGAELFTTHSPCLSCSQLLVNSGILRVVFSELFRETEGLELLTQAGIMVEHFNVPTQLSLI
jgi:dCMP deaminase